MKTFRIFHCGLWFILGNLMASLTVFAQQSGELATDFQTRKAFGSNDIYADYFECSLRLPDGKWLIGGEFSKFSGHATSGIARLLANGDVDTSFSADIPPDFRPKLFKMDAEGRILALVIQSWFIYGRLMRFLPNGNTDTSFHFPNDIEIQNFHITSSGKILLQFSESVSRLLPNGMPDTSFQNILKYSQGICAFHEDEIFACSSFIPFFVRKYKADGQEDTTFHSTLTGFSKNDSFFKLPDGKYQFYGNSNIRFFPNGLEDTSYHSFYIESENKMVHQEGGSLIFALPYSNYSVLLNRYDSNGNLDSSFHPVFPWGNYSLYKETFGWTGIGPISLKNRYESFQMAFFDEDGNILSNANRYGFDNDLQIIKIQPDGKLVVAGDFNHFDGLPISTIARLWPDGQLDTSFHSPFLPGNQAIFKEGIRNISFGPDGKILVCGFFDTVGTTPKTRMVLLLANGSIDPSFNPYLPSFSGDTMVEIRNAFFGQNGKIWVMANLFFPLVPGQTNEMSIVFQLNANGSGNWNVPVRSYPTQLSSIHPGLNGHIFVEESNKGFWDDNISNPTIIQAGIFLLEKLKPDGTKDNSFHFNSITMFGGGEVQRIVENYDGSVFISYYHWMNGLNFLKANANGSVVSNLYVENLFFYQDKPGISPGGILITPDSGVIHLNGNYALIQLSKTHLPAINFSSIPTEGGYITDLAMADSTGFYVVGSFKYLGGKCINRIAKLSWVPTMVSSAKVVLIKNGFEVYPNPGQDQLYIRGPIETPTSLEILDVLGRSIHSAQLLPGSPVPVSFLEKGIYFLRLRNSEKSETLRWVKE